MSDCYNNHGTAEDITIFRGRSVDVEWIVVDGGWIPIDMVLKMQQHQRPQSESRLKCPRDRHLDLYSRKSNTKVSSHCNLHNLGANYWPLLEEWGGSEEGGQWSLLTISFTYLIIRSFLGFLLWRIWHRSSSDRRWKNRSLLMTTTWSLRLAYLHRRHSVRPFVSLSVYQSLPNRPQRYIITHARNGEAFSPFRS